MNSIRGYFDISIYALLPGLLPANEFSTAVGIRPTR